MQKYTIISYQKPNSWFVNGGKLIITETECIVKYLFQTVAKFERNKTLVSKISPFLFRQGIHLTDGVKSINIYLTSNTTNKVYNLLNH